MSEQDDMILAKDGWPLLKVRFTVKITTGVAFMLLAPLSASAQGKVACKVYFKVEFDDSRIAGGFIPRMDSTQEKWWETKGQKKYPEICYDDAKAQYVFKWRSEEHSKLVDVPQTTTETQTVPTQGTVTDTETGETATVSGTSEVTTTSTSHHLEERDWATASMNVLRISEDGKPQLPPVYVVLGQRGGSAVGRALAGNYGASFGGSPQRNALEAGLKFVAAKTAK